MGSNGLRGEELRRKAEDKFRQATQKRRELANEMTRIRQAEAEKTLRLRGLRLAKEAADKEAEAKAIHPAGPVRRRVAGPAKLA